jgi:hypothetical protein
MTGHEAGGKMGFSFMLKFMLKADKAGKFDMSWLPKVAL